MANGDETADSYKTTAEFNLSRKGDKSRIIIGLFRAATLYSDDHRDKAIECLNEIYVNVRGGTAEFDIEQYFRYMHRLAKAYEDHAEILRAADCYTELAKEIYSHKTRLLIDKVYSGLQILKKFSAYLAKALMLYDSIEKYDSILKIARTFYKVFPSVQGNESIQGELYFCYEHIIHAADVTGSRYFREYYESLDRKMRGIPLYDEAEEVVEGKGPYGHA